MKQNYLVFTDLDGTLLNHHDYDFSQAQEALSWLQKASIPLILTTSKTFAEVIELQEKLGIHEAFIVENGAGIFIPSNSPLVQPSLGQEQWVKRSHGHSYHSTRNFFQKMKKDYSIKGFGDLNVDEVMALTQLDQTAASNAMKRDFTEPFLIEDLSSIDALQKKAQQEGFDIVQGGRFFHLISFGQDKANAMLTLTQMYDKSFGLKHQMIALGDSANDFSMIKKADIGVLIPHSDGSFAPLEDEHVTKALFPGPKGWNHAIKEIFDVV